MTISRIHFSFFWPNSSLFDLYLFNPLRLLIWRWIAWKEFILFSYSTICRLPGISILIVFSSRHCLQLFLIRLHGEDFFQLFIELLLIFCFVFLLFMYTFIMYSYYNISFHLSNFMIIKSVFFNSYSVAPTYILSPTGFSFFFNGCFVYKTISIQRTPLSTTADESSVLSVLNIFILCSLIASYILFMQQ